MESDEDQFPLTVSTLLEQGDSAKVKNLFTEKQHSEIYNNAWDLVPIVARYLTEESRNVNSELFKCCQKIISIIAENSKPEEVLLQFIEELELATDDTKFLCMLKPSRTVLLRVPDRRVTSLGWYFNAIKSYIEKLEIPEEFDLSNEERLLLESNDSVCRINNVYDNVLLFSETFIEELLRSDAINERKQVMGKFLVDLLGKPLAFLEMDIFKNTKPRARVTAEFLAERLCSLNSDPFSFLEMNDSDKLIKPNNLSLGILYFLILAEYFDINIPRVYSPVYILHNILNLVNNLLSCGNQIVLEKGVRLAMAVLRTIDDKELSYLLLDSENSSKFCKNISDVIIHNGNEKIRKQSLRILQKYLWSFDHKGRYLIIINLMNHLSHSGLKGNIIIQYKEMITEEIKNGNLHNLPKFYKQQKLFSLLDNFTFLAKNEETDLVDNSDQIVSTLNLLRYLIIVDKDNESGIGDYLNGLEVGYFKYLTTGINLAKEHYRLRIKEIKEEGRGDREDSSCKMSVTVSGKNLIEMSDEKKLEVLNLSLTTLDVLDSLLNRVMECINSKN